MELPLRIEYHDKPTEEQDGHYYRRVIATDEFAPATTLFRSFPVALAVTGSRHCTSSSKGPSWVFTEDLTETNDNGTATTATHAACWWCLRPGNAGAHHLKRCTGR